MSRNNLIQFRKGTLSEFNSVNPVLASGEPGYATDANVLKVGDGLTPWSALLGFSVGSGITSLNGLTASSLVITGGHNIDVATSGTEVISVAYTGVDHVPIPGISNVDNSGNRFIQDLLFDQYGHVTGVASVAVTGIPTVPNNVLASGDNISLLTNDIGYDTIPQYTLGADSTNHYLFSGPGLSVSTPDPTLYLVRGRTYKFTNSMGAHPFQFQSTAGIGGTAYTSGIDNSPISNTTMTWEVRHDTPNILYYQCTSHANMNGTVYILDIDSIPSNVLVSGDNISLLTNDVPYAISGTHIAITNAASSVNNSSNDFVQDLLFDEFGHVTGVVSQTVTDVDNFIDGSGTTNYLPVFSDSDTLTNSIINQSGNTIGINTPANGVNFTIHAKNLGSNGSWIINENAEGNSSNNTVFEARESGVRLGAMYSYGTAYSGGSLASVGSGGTAFASITGPVAIGPLDTTKDLIFGAGTAQYAKMTSSEFRVNHDGLNRDFRVEGDSQEDLFFIDASTDTANIGSVNDGFSKLYVKDTQIDKNLSSTEKTSRGINVFKRDYITSSAGVSPTGYAQAIATRVEKFVAPGVTDNGYAIGGNFVALHDDGGTLNEVVGVRSNAGGYYSHSGVIKDLISFKAVPVNIGSGSITNLYNFYIHSTTPSNVTNAYSIYAAATDQTMYHAGKVGIGTASPEYILDVDGSGRFRCAPTGLGLAVVNADNSGLLFGEIAYGSYGGSYSGDLYTGMTHTALSGEQEYILLSKGDHTFMSAKDGSSSIIRGGNNNQTYQLLVNNFMFSVGQFSEKMKFDSSKVQFNLNNENLDFAVHGDALNNVLYVDASVDRVGIGTDSPATALHIVASGGEGTVLSRTVDADSWAGLLIRNSQDQNVASFQYGNSGVSHSPSLQNTVLVGSRQSGIPVKFYQGAEPDGAFRHNNERIIFDSDGNTIVTAASGQFVEVSGTTFLVHSNKDAPTGSHVSLINVSGTYNLVAGQNNLSNDYLADHTQVNVVNNGVLYRAKAHQTDLNISATGTVNAVYGYDTNIEVSSATTLVGHRTTINSTGNVANVYGIWLQALPTGTTATYGIYENNSHADNYFAGNVGIGTDSPSTKLEVANNGNTTIRANNTSNNIINILNVDSTKGYIGTVTDHDLGIGTNSNTRIHISNSGNVGIGTSSPAYKLDVAGSGSFDALNINDAFTFPTGDGSVNQILVTDGNGNVSWVDQSAGGGGNLTGNGTINFVPKWSSVSGLTDSVIYESGDNIGINTTNPKGALEVYDVGLASSGSFYFAAGNTNDAVGTYVANVNPTGDSFMSLGVDGSAVNWVLMNDASGRGTDDTFVLMKGNISSDDVKLAVTNVGYLGLGTDNPSGLLHTKASDNESNLFIQEGSRASGSAQFLQKTHGYTSAGGLISYATGYVAGSLASVGAGGAALTNMGQFPLAIAPLYTSQPILFGAGNDEYMRSQNGNLMIGRQASHEFAGFNTLSIDGANGSFIDLYEAGTASFRLQGDATYGALQTLTAIPIRFLTDQTERMRIDESGNVGIGTTDPANRLYVAGGDGTAYIQSGIITPSIAFRTSDIPKTGATIYDGFIAYQNSDCWGLGNNANDGFVFEKTDGNAAIADGGIFFNVRGSGGISSTAMSINGRKEIFIGQTGTYVAQGYSLNVAGGATFADSVKVVHPDGSCGLMVEDTGGSGVHIGDCAYSDGDAYAGMKHSNHTGGQEYMIISAGHSTVVSSKTGNSTYIRAGGNATTYQTVIGPSAWGIGPLSNRLRVDSQSVLVNNGTGNYDFKVYGQNNATPLIHADADTHTIGIGRGTATSRRLTIAGTGTADNSAAVLLQGTGVGTDTTDGFLFSQSNTGLGYLWNFENKATIFGTNNLERMRITEDGKVGVGTDNPAGKLHVDGTTFFRGDIVQSGGNIAFNQNGEDYNFRVEGDTDQHLLFVDGGTDRIGIGTGTPAHTLDILGSFRVNRINNQVLFGSAANIFNANEHNIDFRIAGDSQTNLFYVDASTDSIGIATDTPGNNKFRIHHNTARYNSENTAHIKIQNSGSTIGGLIGADATDDIFYIQAVNPGTSWGKNLAVQSMGGNFGVGTITPAYKLDVSGTFSANSVNVNNAYTLPTADGTAGHSLVTDGAGNIIFSGVTGGGGITGVVEDTAPRLGGGLNLNSNNITGTGNINIAGSIDAISATFSDGAGSFTLSRIDSTTATLKEAAGSIEFIAGASTTPAITITNHTFTSPVVTINDDQINMDFRVEGDAEENLLYADASTDRVGIGTATPAHKLDVIGMGRFVHADGVCGLQVEDTGGSGVHIGDCAFSEVDRFSGMKHSNHSLSGEYMIISQGTSTFVSSASGHPTYIRAGNNDINYQAICHADYFSVGDHTPTDKSIPAQRFQITNSGAAFNVGTGNYDFKVYGHNNATQLIHADAALNRVGIGTATPAYQLDVVGTGTFDALNINDAYAFPTGDGTAGHSLVTDGAGNIIFSGVAGGGKTYTAGTGIVLGGGDNTVINVVDNVLLNTEIQAGNNINLIYDSGNGTLTINSTANVIGSGVDAAMTQGRLTVESGVPVTYNDTTSSTIYFTPFRGDKVSLYNGSQWALHTFTEMSLDISALSTDSNYDVFVYDNSGTLTLEAVIWNSHAAGTSTRATDLVLQDGVYVKSGATTRKYVGSFRTLSSAETRDADDSRLLWNYYNRIRKRVRAQLSTTSATTSWTYNSSTVRAIANNTTVGNGRFIIMNGLIEDALQMTATSLTNGGSNSMTTTIGYNSTTSRTSSIAAGPYAVAGSASPAAIAMLVHTPNIGYHFYQQQEHRNFGSSTYTGYARNSVGHSHTGIEGEFLC